jgi:hypothetical protein
MSDRRQSAADVRKVFARANQNGSMRCYGIIISLSLIDIKMIATMASGVVKKGLWPPITAATREVA